MSTPSGRMSIPEIRHQSGLSSSLQSSTRKPTSRLQRQMREIGGYYSKFKSAFLFRVDPTEQVKELFA